MGDIELVIKIPEESYTALIEIKDSLQRVQGFEKFIVNGTILPKGHGDLIDRGELKTHFIGTEQGTDLEVYLEPTIVGAKAIIKADTRSEVNNDHQNLERSL